MTTTLIVGLAAVSLIHVAQTIKQIRNEPPQEK